jgi:phosphoribosylglycinamide formyltransferase 2
MVTIGTPHSAKATKFLLLGSGELGKEVAIEAQRLGVEVIAVDRYANAPAMQVAHRSHVISMLDGDALRAVIEKEKPDFIVPEIEAISTSTLVKLEQEGYRVVPTANATHLTMNREGIRRLAAEILKLPTSPYQFATIYEEYQHAIKTIGIPCVVKPVMSSSGKGQSVIRDQNDIKNAWDIAQTSGRGNAGTVIIEAFIPFDYEITLLTVRHAGGTSFCAPIGHLQVNGDYQESWQPHPMSKSVLEKAQYIAKAVTDELGGYGLFGVEFFIKGDNVYFSEVSPRPHDTGLVTLISQNLSEFALHVRAILGLPIPTIRQFGPAASCALLAHGNGSNIQYRNLDKALNLEDTQLRLFGKPEVRGERRVGVALSLGDTIELARAKAKAAMKAVEIEIS